jgi:pantothenate kinase
LAGKTPGLETDGAGSAGAGMSKEQTTLSLSPEAALDHLTKSALDLAAGDGRIALGIAGGPGVGKSTLAQDLVERLNAGRPGLAAFVPMDGFHMLHAKLETLGLVKDKGAPHTFEGAAFAERLNRLKAANGTVDWPGYSRKIEDVVEGAYAIGPEVKILIVEGNYLLLGEEPWSAVKPLLDLSVFIAVPRETVRARLMVRHAEEGLFSEERNREHIERVDLTNYDRVTRSRPRADLAIDLLVER